MNIPAHQKGISLVEILVAMVISIFLLGGVVQVYIGNKATYNFSEAISRIQENGRFAMDIITRDLRMAGFWGCATFDPTDTTNMVNNLDPNGPGYDQNLHDFVGQPAVQGAENNGLNGSDTITIRGAAPGQASIVPPYNSPTSANIFANVSDFINIDDVVLLTNCKGADIFQVSNITAGAGAAKLAVVHNSGTGAPGNYNPGGCNAGHCLSQTYGNDASILKLQTIIYSIAAGTSGEGSLFRAEFANNAELVDGIEQMQILYGVNTDTDNTTPNQYVTSNNVADWNTVTAVRVMLLAVSPENVVFESDQTYRYNGQNITSNDGRLRQVFSTTIALRN